MFVSDTDIRRAGRRLISAYGSEAWFIASDLAIAASRAGEREAADVCNRIALAIEEMGSARACPPRASARSGVRSIAG
jgi:hypothetical protein